MRIINDRIKKLSTLDQTNMKETAGSERGGTSLGTVRHRADTEKGKWRLNVDKNLEYINKQNT